MENVFAQGDATDKSLAVPTRDDRQIGETVASSFYFPTLVFADEIGLFPFLAQSPAAENEVAANFSMGANGAGIILGLLSGLGFLEQYNGRFQLTDVGRIYLMPDSVYYCGGVLRMMSQQPMTPARVRELLEQDRVSSQHTDLSIKDVWHLSEMPAEIAAGIAAAVHANSLPPAISAAQLGNFTGVQHLLNIAGGLGSYCIALALRYANMNFTVMEAPAICKQVEHYAASYGLQDRIQTLVGSTFTDPWPSDCDAVFFSDVFHDWDRATCLIFARRCFELLPQGGHIFVHELLLNETKDGPLVVLAFSLNMLSSFGGKLYTAKDLTELLEEAGFVNVSVIPTYRYYSLISASKPGA